LCLPHMRARKFGKIFNISSIGGKIVTPLGGWYHASKFALEGYSDSLRMEVRPFGIDVIVIEPGGIKTEWGDIAMDNLHRRSGTGPYGRLVEASRRVFGRVEGRASEPRVIAQLIGKAVAARTPGTRYAAGFMS